MTKAIGKYHEVFMQQQLTKAIKYWSYIAPIVKYPKNKKQYVELTTQLDELLDIVGDNENHRLMGLVDSVSYLVSLYDEQELHEPKIKGIDALKFLMKSHHLSQSDLSEIGSQGVVSEILRGKRLLNLRQIKLLAKRFKVDSSTFIDD